MTHKVGDIIKIRSWLDLKHAFYKDSEGDIKLTNVYFTKGMRQFCGSSFIIINEERNEYPRYRLKSLARVPIQENTARYSFTEEMFEMVPLNYDLYKVKKKLAIDNEFDKNLL